MLYVFQNLVQLGYCKQCVIEKKKNARNNSVFDIRSFNDKSITEGTIFLICKENEKIP